MTSSYRTPSSVLLLRSKKRSIAVKNRFSSTFLKARAHANQHQFPYSPTRREMEYLSNDWEYQNEHKKGPLPKPEGELRHLLKEVTEIFIAGGGGAGRALPSALKEAAEFGLDLSKVKVVCASSVGSILALAIAIGIPAQRMGQVLNDMPADNFQDWSFSSIINFFTRWGWCQGDAMPNYFKQLIKAETGLEDPTFLQLYQAGYRKELRVMTANVSRQRAVIFSHLTTPHEKVARAVGLACSIPLVFPPQWIANEKGELEAYTDGGLAKNYPWGVGSIPGVRTKQQLGFITINKYGTQASTLRSRLISFWHYLRGLLTLVFTQDPLCLSGNVKERTVAITVNHNPLNFCATTAQQAALDEAGRIGVRRFARHWRKKINEFQLRPKMLSSFAFKCRSHKPAVEKAVKLEQRHKYRP